ncbi:phosphatidate cytidylyltransferase [Litchfieldella qijiaojingensis]|uniref:Phosphatidate cytidylyltransferase n=1 Tax=Litchfieldella qijiaojingensis TaxID=980347 RepID=A0ABQ2YWC4_9GAMM|nr:phosphatidate cytidylyltransferase [Halomonas qijiaojingensis]GGX97538.1 phosphatidate cytidylyltransferase [Halomonas qijiaojingensis]
MLRQRVLTALFLAPLALAGLFGLRGAPFALFTGAILLAGVWEWVNLAGFESRKARWSGVAGAALIMLLLWVSGAVQDAWPLWLGALGWLANLYWVVHYPERQEQWGAPSRRLLMGLWVLLPCWVGFVTLRESGVEWLLFVLLLVWLADTGAYFAGRAYGRHKLAPRVSPGKSWEGVLGGMAATALLAVVFAVWLSLGLGQALLLVASALVVTLVSVLGDLLESMLKRTRGIKDSSALLPGHGGVLDRIDSLTAAVPVFALLWLWK